MSDVPDVNGEFEVAGLPEIVGAVWTISKREGPTPEYPDKWWDYDVAGQGFWLTLTVDSEEWVIPIWNLMTDGGIVGQAQQLYEQRLGELRGGTAETTNIHPIPKA